MSIVFFAVIGCMLAADPTGNSASPSKIAEAAAVITATASQPTVQPVQPLGPKGSFTPPGLAASKHHHHHHHHSASANQPGTSAVLSGPATVIPVTITTPSTISVPAPVLYSYPAVTAPRFTFAPAPAPAQDHSLAAAQLQIALLTARLASVTENLNQCQNLLAGGLTTPEPAHIPFPFSFKTVPRYTFAPQPTYQLQPVQYVNSSTLHPNVVPTGTPSRPATTAAVVNGKAASIASIASSTSSNASPGANHIQASQSLPATGTSTQGHFTFSPK